MARNDGRVEKGQSIRSAFSAKAWNRAQDAADIVLGVQPGIEAGSLPPSASSYTWMNVRNGNSNGQTIPRWGPVLFGEWAYTSSLLVATDGSDGAGTKMFEDSPVLVGRTPGRGPARAAAFGVAVEPIPGQSIGRVAVSGVVQCKVRTNDAEIGHVPYAVPDTSTGWLRASGYSDRYGGATIIHVDLQAHQDGLSWALIRLDSPPPIRRGIIRNTWYNGTQKQVFEIGSAGYTQLENGESRQLPGTSGSVTGTDGGPTVYAGEFTAWNYLATLEIGNVPTTGGSVYLPTRWVYCANVGGQWNLIAYETIRTSGLSVRDSASNRLFV